MMDHDATRIVLIDPDEGPRALTALEPVSDSEVTIHRVPAGPPALQAASVLRPDLIVLAATEATDEIIGLCRRLRADATTAGIPLLVLALNAPAKREATAALVASWMRGGVDDVLTAPVPPDLLRARVGLLVEVRRLRRDSFGAATQDATGPLVSKRVFEATLRRESERLRRSDGNMALMIVELDHAAAWRESAGELAFETAFHRVAETVAGRLRRPPDLAARLGSGRIAGLLPETDLRGARVVAESILGAVIDLGVPHPAESVPALLSVSIGLASQRCSGPEVGTWLMTEAVDRLGQARRAGGNRLSALSARRTTAFGSLGVHDHEDDAALMEAAATWERHQGAPYS